MAGKKRDYGEGTVFQRSDGRWVVRYKPEGSTKKIEKYAKTESEGKKILRELKKDVIRNDYKEIQKISVRTFMDDWLYNIKAIELKPKSFDALECTVINQVYKNIGDIQINAITADDVQAMINKLVAEEYEYSTTEKKHYTYSTIKKAYNAINACFKFGIIKGKVSKNPCVGVVLPKNLKRKVSDIRFFEQAEIDLICKESIACYKNGRQIYRLGYAIILLLSTGMRIAELLGLKWSNVNFDNKTIKVTNTIVLTKNRDKKTSKKYVKLEQDSTKTDSSDRIIDLNDTAINALQEIFKINGNQAHVMATESGKVIGAKNIDRMLRNILVKCNIEPCGVHALRHSYASMLFRNGVDAKTVSELLGHADVAFTYNVYIHLIKEQKRQAAAVIDKAVSISTETVG